MLQLLLQRSYLLALSLENALKIAKGERSRPLEDAVVSRCALLGLARACGIEPLDPVLELTAADALESAFEAAGGS